MRRHRLVGIIAGALVCAALLALSLRVSALEERAAEVTLTVDTPIVMHWHYSDGLDMCKPELTTLGLFVQKGVRDPKVRLAELKAALEVDIQTQDLVWLIAHESPDGKTW